MFEFEEKALSDHLPFSALIKMSEERSIKLLTFNMMNQMDFIENAENYSWSFLNNGFGCSSESSEAYKTRLSLIANRINTWIKCHKASHTPLFIALQEGPLNKDNQALDYFLSLLDKNFKVASFSKTTNSIITLCDPTYDCSEALTEEMNNNLLSQGLKERTLLSVFTHKETQEPILLVNVHANFNLEIIKDIQALSKKAKELGIKHLIFSGDHNRNLTRVENDTSHTDVSSNKDSLSAYGLTAYNVQNASFVRRLDTKQLIKGSILSELKLLPVQIETRDGVISTQPVSLKIESNFYLVSSLHPEYKNLDPALLKIPEGFLTNLNAPQLESKNNLFTSLAS